MKQKLLLPVLLLLALLRPLAGRAQAPAWQSAVSTSGAAVNAVAVNAAGDTFITGSYSGSATFGAPRLPARAAPIYSWLSTAPAPTPLPGPRAAAAPATTRATALP
ncbi:hypothetical protein [Hymenobacter sp. BRD67]|uniref:hypothetical protein n=1 Tax=Hymenobacter sp. BRD67 TaxID=2675877 RepID=UPI00156754EF|nr:hypothetical protein [Hymenobacter sp. BRD67]QKG53177.1 hypothetical protein GKZ67_11955 [Hymenobacter sp. BRD67]